ncbi:MAG: hypothetical protein V7638_3702 [Acidobacteriota bacterium]|jgi:predicted ABC-type ATPase
MPGKQRIIIIGGPNGAGKTTFAREYLIKEAHCPDFINVDLIAAGLSRFKPEHGHDVSSKVVRRRFDAGLCDFQDVYKHLVDKWEWYDNSGNTPD